MNKFCIKCAQKSIPSFLKKKFNQHANKIFIDECPLVDKKVIGCTTKLLEIDWPNFCNFLLQNNFLTNEEKKIIEKIVDINVGDSKIIP